MDKKKVVVDPRVICEKAGVTLRHVDEANNVVYVDDVKRLAEYLGIELIFEVEGVESGGWLWTTKSLPSSK